MSRDDLNETLQAIARTRGTPSITGGDYLSCLDMLHEIERDLAQAIYDDTTDEDLQAVVDDIRERA